MKKIIIVAESGSDITEEQAKAFGVQILPMHVNFPDETLNDGEFPVSRIFEYYKRTKKIPSTSAVNPEEYETLFEQIHAENPEAVILHLCYSAVTTCTWQNALIASEGKTYVRHIDTKCVSMGQAAVVLRTAKYISEHPEKDIDEVCAQVQEWVKAARMYFFPENLDYLRAGGRVSNAQCLGAAILSLKPLIEILDGHLVSGKKYRGSMLSVGKKMLKDVFEKGLDKSGQLFLIYSEGLAEDTKKALEEYVKELGAKKVCWMKTGCVISVHGGPGAFGIAGFSC